MLGEWRDVLRLSQQSRQNSHAASPPVTHHPHWTSARKPTIVHV